MGRTAMIPPHPVGPDRQAHDRGEDALRESEETFRAAFDHAPIGMALVGLDGRWLKVNRSICRIVGYAEEQLLALSFQELTHPDDLEADLDQVRQMVAGELTGYEMEKRYFHRDGHIVWALLSVSLVRDARGRPKYFISQIQDVSDRKRMEAQLRETNARLAALAASDGLTGLTNRRQFEHVLDAEFERARRYGTALSAVLLDVDHFKNFNDSFGHLAGDDVLKEVARALRGVARQSDTVARYGGEEFLLLLPHTDEAGAEQFAERARQAVEAANWRQRLVTVSVGVSSLKPLDPSGEPMIARADAALYEAKRTGRNRVCMARLVTA